MKDKLHDLWRFICLIPSLLGLAFLLLFGDPQEEDEHDVS